MTYEDSNIFAKILRGEIPCEKVLENAYALAFNDIAPQAPVHILVIPKQPYESASQFFQNAADSELVGFHRLVGEVVSLKGIHDSGYRLIANTNRNGHQEVPHYHVHVLGGRDLGRMVF
ncbi:MAG: histidine triad nucleotide-binding protein [Rhodospirillaceae bacterium]|nr:histidine triad nucleotide-binding protein [Rhodospirillaceae bacterium]MBC27157.1 histidine triad nucleotide-binding protein [Rhodospirillaceae bacterium]|tara:strand:- start:3720 stop:4076 length:357 start_codon:yes stop_codon:yes gene_type:complete